MFNMKKMKKPLVLLLTLIMVLSMSATAFAAAPVTVNVSFFDEKEPIWKTQEVTLSADDIDRTYYDLQKYPDATNPCDGKPSVLDAIIEATYMINKTQARDEKLTYHIDWAPESTDATTGEVYPDGFYMDDIYVGDPDSGDNDYITVNTFIPGTDTTPNISKGSGWSGFDGENEFTAYLSNVPLTEGMNINFIYKSYRYEW